MSTGSFSQYFAIEKDLHKRGFRESRKELIELFTDGQKSGLRDLTAEEYSQFIAWLNSYSSPRNGGMPGRTVGKIEAAGQRPRRKIIALFCQMGYVIDGKPDMFRINSWCISHGHLHVRLNDYHGADLGKLVTQVENVYNTFTRGIWK